MPSKKNLVSWIKGSVADISRKHSSFMESMAEYHHGGLTLFLAFVVCSVLFLLSRLIVPLPIRNLFTLIFGGISFVWIPGALLSYRVVLRNLWNFWVAIILGIFLNIAMIQVNLLMSILLSFSLPLWIILPVGYSILITLSFLVSGFDFDYKCLLNLGMPRSCIFVMVIGLAIRVIIAILSGASIAPDASLYSDYARNVVDGNFISNVSNDPGVESLITGQDLIGHQLVTYVFSLSFVLWNPGIGGPKAILIALGLSLVYLSFEIATHIFGETAGKFIGFVVACHPLFAFFSSVAYGPEVSSLVFLSFIVLLLLRNQMRCKSATVLVGVMFPFVEAIWPPNYLILSIILLFLSTLPPSEIRISRLNVALFAGVMGIIAIFSTTLDSALLIFAIGIGLSLSVTKSMTSFAKDSTLLLLPSSLISYEFLQWPRQSLIVSEQNANMLAIIPNSVPSLFSVPDIFYILQTEISPTFILKFIETILFHLSIPILVILVLSLVWVSERGILFRLVSIAAVIATGTSIVIASLARSKEVLTIAYVYSDSRFLISIIFVLIISCGPGFDRLVNRFTRFRPGFTISSNMRLKRQGALTLILLMGFLPGYALFPTGISLVQVENQYGWHGLKEAVESLEFENPTYILDRAREFSWLTGKKSITLQLSYPEMAEFKALHQLDVIRNRFDADIFVLDRYTISRWQTFGSLYEAPLINGDITPLQTGHLKEDYYRNVTDSTNILQFLQDTPTRNGDLSRLFKFGQGEFGLVSRMTNLSSGWAASNNGVLIPDDHNNSLLIGAGQSYTNLWRPGNNDLDIVIQSGYVMIRFRESSAVISRISLWSDQGGLLGFAKDIRGGYFFAALGRVLLGDVRIVLEGNPGDFAIIDSISIWQQLKAG